MHAFLHGVPWVHLFPAVLAIIIGFIFLKLKWIYFKVIFGVLWLFFLPNTAYMFTDVVRITLHWSSVSMIARVGLIIQFILLELIGLVTYLLAMLPFESMINTWNFSRKEQIIAIVILNFFVGFGMVLGRTGYVNSYAVSTQPTKVILAVMNTVTSLNLLGLAIVFGILCNCIYFLFRSLLSRRMKGIYKTGASFRV